MKIGITRRKMMSVLTGMTIGSGLIPQLFSNRASASTMSAGINVGVSPPGPKSLALLKDLKESIARSNYCGLFSIGLNRGHGCYVEDLDGNVYLDCLTSASSTILGYSYDEIAKAHYETSLKLQHTAFPYSPNVETVEFAEKLIRIAPGDFSKKVIIGLSGSDSMGGAIEAARKFTGKMGVISFNMAYHGSTGLSQAASGFRSLNEGVYDLNDPDFVKVDFPATDADADRVLKNIEAILAFGKTAAVLVEIIQGDGGTMIAPPFFFARLRELLDSYQVLFIDDEIQTGMGRTGKWWAIDHEGVVPDIIVTGKGLAAGYAPVSAIIGRTEILNSLVPATQVFTFMGHPPTVSAASRVIDIIERDDLIENARETGAYLLENLIESAKKYPDVIVKARGKGCMIGLEINISKNLLASKIFAYRCVEKGVYFGYIGDKQRVIRVLPPITAGREEAKIIVNTVNATADEMSKGKIPQSTVDKVNRYAIGW
jgi:4-aminobutyrate aminotransferase-like enzyme